MDGLFDLSITSITIHFHGGRVLDINGSRSIYKYEQLNEYLWSQHTRSRPVLQFAKDTHSMLLLILSYTRLGGFLI